MEYSKTLKMIESGFFCCWEDAIDYINSLYKREKITLKERNILLNAI